jgi:hypothetical protein
MKMYSLIATILLAIISVNVSAQSIDVNPDKGDYYTIAPDYRRCIFPYCGGWWLTKVNSYSLTAEADVLDSSIIPTPSDPIYVVEIDYAALGLSKDEIYEFERNIYNGRAFIRGELKPYTGIKSGWGWQNLRNLAATGTWLAANDNAAIGPYLNVKSTGIVCITTPCPYYKANVLNSSYSTEVHELNFERANLTNEQMALAWRALSQNGLIMTGVGFVSQGQVGTGLGIAATRVFFSFPGSTSIF